MHTCNKNKHLFWMLIFRCSLYICLCSLEDDKLMDAFPCSKNVSIMSWMGFEANFPAQRATYIVARSACADSRRRCQVFITTFMNLITFTSARSVTTTPFGRNRLQINQLPGNTAKLLSYQSTCRYYRSYKYRRDE
jgi:hypothetical protein